LGKIRASDQLVVHRDSYAPRNWETTHHDGAAAEASRIQAPIEPVAHISTISIGRRTCVDLKALAPDGQLLMKETMVKPSLDPFTAAPATMQAMLDLERRAKNCSLEHRLSELVKTWASQINGWRSPEAKA
jgi:hypothetical protein